MMHRAFLQLAALLALLAVMAAAGGCVALYTVSRALERPADAGGGMMGPPLFPPVTTPPILPPTAIPAVTAQTPGGDGLPFNPFVTDTPPPVPAPLVTGAPAGTVPPSNATPPRVPMPTDTPPVAGPPPHDLIPRPSLPATPL